MEAHVVIENNVTFVWNYGARWREDPQAVGEELKDISRNGEVTAPVVVDYARKHPRSTLHKMLEWDEKEAAEQWRRHQVRTIIAALRVVTEDHPEPVHAYFHVHTASVDAYVSRNRLMTDDELRAKALEDAFGQLEGVERRYHELEELSPVWESVAEARRRAQEQGE